MADDVAAARRQVARQVAHWRGAVVGLGDLDAFAAPEAWRSLEQYLGTALRRQLTTLVQRLTRQGDVLVARLAAAETLTEVEEVRRDVVAFRRRYQDVETALDFYGDAVNTRTTPRLAALLGACDVLAGRSLDAVLGPLGRPSPPVLTYLDRGLGASILRAGLTIWGGRSTSVAAAIKITRHNLHRPTAVLHEAGHQAAFMIGWNDELAAALQRELADRPRVGAFYASWSSEIAADTFAFAHAGYGALAALADVVAGESTSVHAIQPFDPHPAAYVRVLLGIEMAVRCFGAGPWIDLRRSWVRAYPLAEASASARPVLRALADVVPRVVEVCLQGRMRAFGGRSLTDLVDPARVSPDALARLRRDVGPALLTSPYWVRAECLRLLAASGYRAATEPEASARVAHEFENWMLLLGSGTELAA